MSADLGGGSPLRCDKLKITASHMIHHGVSEHGIDCYRIRGYITLLRLSNETVIRSSVKSVKRVGGDIKAGNGSAYQQICPDTLKSTLKHYRWLSFLGPAKWFVVFSRRGLFCLSFHCPDP